MNFWKPKHTTCSECGVHFEPVIGHESRWGNLCSTHRKPVMERDRKKDAVISWASSNWERLAKIMDEENEAYNKAMSSFNQQANLQQGSALGNIFGLGG